ncbi:SpaH/EbpB family LPXTG-anchored major pilin [Propionimicrobium sp. BV2F7]|uniref:SpaH/EbpB family LPXTG-anchored major pilin n=1 Tax=Propionimicrobium sp. BV2F7 TaxID=1111131 RepID=UPI0003D79A8D|nr:SpaH/EbpB family LPXTG-anchored major pilin [Propionimicrobium sp. BV2F7]ETJ98198.1 putative lactose-sensitive fimbrial protein [Propionimicrobium sp. BV2F7]
MKKTKKALALIAASCLIGTSGVLTGLGATAHAEGDVTLDNIDSTQPTKLTIHKHEENSNPAVTPDGKSGPLPKPLEGVEFTTYKITSLDLANKYQDWDTLAKVTDVPSTVCADAAKGSFTIDGTQFTVEKGNKLTPTNGDGITIFDKPAIAAYLVCETKAPAKVTVPARPFIATIPMPYNKSWLYDVHAYPKNEVGEAKKENVKQEGLGLGSKVSFKVTTDIPKLPAGYDKLAHYVVSDTFDARLTYKAVPSVKVVGGDTFKEGDDYTIEAAAKEEGQKQTVRVKFTDAGLTKLKTLGGKKVEVTFDTTVSSVGDGTIKNEAEYSTDPNNEFEPKKKGNPTNEVKTKWGNVKVLKYADNDEKKLLKDAKFEVYAPKDDSLYPKDGKCTDTAIPADAKPISVNTKAEFISDENGVVTIDGLFVSAKYKETDAQGVVTEKGNESDTRCYILKEIEPPVGYVKVADPIALKVTAGETAAGTYDLKVNNNKQIVPGLPLTGAQGAIALTGGGIALVAIAAGALTVAHRRNKELA